MNVDRVEVGVPVSDGTARAVLVTPRGDGPFPAVILFMDVFGIRPALTGIAERLAGHGYVVLVPDMFWRAGAYGPLVPAMVMGDEVLKRDLFGRLRAATDTERADRDTSACLDYLAGLAQVEAGPVGVVGYCMGGGIALRAAGLFPNRVVSAAAFHPGRLATDAPDSPHLLADRIRARVLVAGADADASFPAEEADRLRAALDAAGVANRVTIYAGARHGFVPADTPAHDHDAMERHWVELLALFDETLMSARA